MRRSCSPVWQTVFRAIVLLLLLAGCSAPFRATVTLGEDEIARKVAPLFPLKRSAIVASIELNHPRVLFEEGTDRIGVELDAIATVMEEERAGTAAVLGHLRYRAETGEFFLVDPEVVRLDIPDLPEEHREPIRIATSAVVRAALPSIPVHRVENASQKAFIKSVDVKDRRVLVELGI